MERYTSLTPDRRFASYVHSRLAVPRLAGALLALPILLLLVGCAGSAPPKEGSERWKSIVVEGLELRTPPTWSDRRLGVHCVRSGPGVLVSNLDARSFRREAPPARGGCTTRWKVHGVPREFVLVDLSRFKFPVVGSLGDSAFPPELETSRQESRSCQCTFEFADLWLHHLGYTVRVWIGENASVSDRKALDAMISSIRPKGT